MSATLTKKQQRGYIKTAKTILKTLSGVLKSFQGNYSKGLGDGATMDDLMASLGVVRTPGKPYTPKDVAIACQAVTFNGQICLYRSKPVHTMFEPGNPDARALRAYPTKDKAETDMANGQIKVIVPCPIENGQWTVDLLFRVLEQARDHETWEEKAAASISAWETLDKAWVLVKAKQEDGTVLATAKQIDKCRLEY